MNNIHSKVWDAARGVVVVASEHARARGKSASRTKRTLALAITLAALPYAAQADVCSGNFADGSAPTAASNTSLACGPNATAAATASTALGAGSAAQGANSVALGANSIADRDNTVSVGSAGDERQITNVAAGTADTDAVNLAQLQATAGTASHYLAANGAGDGSDDAQAFGDYGTALGSAAFSLGTGATALGSGASAVGDFATATGYGAYAGGANSLALGSSASASNDQAIAIGASASAQDQWSTALGSGASAVGNYAAAFGVGAMTNGIGTLAMGNYTQALADHAVAVGAGALADGEGSTALGGAIHAFPGSIGPYHATQADGYGATALGSGAVAANDFSTAVGVLSEANGVQSTAVGYLARTFDDYATAVGEFAWAQGANSVALGANSIADRDNTVSVGSAGDERQITNVAAGTADTDAVNVGQLKAAGLTDGNGDALTAVTYDDAGKASLTLGGANGTKIRNVAAGDVSQDSTDAVNGGQLYSTNQAVAQNTSAVQAIDGSAVFYADDAHTRLALGDGSTPVTVSNVAAGTAATDAVNVSQLDQAVAGVGVAAGSSLGSLGQSVAQVLGGNASYGANGFNAPSYLIQGTTYNSVGAAFGAMDSSLSSTLDRLDTMDQQLGQIQQDVSENNSKVPTGSGGGLSIGDNSQAKDGRDTAVGNGATIGADGSTAVGNNAQIAAAATNAVAVGADSSVTAASGVALGQGASATAENAVALGAGSVADEADTVSVGSSSQQRRVTNVAAGTAATDAVNKGQLDDATQEAVQTAENYADNGDAQTLNSANAYTDSKLAGAVSSSDFSAFRSQVDQQFHAVNTRLDRVGAMGAAMAGMAGAIAAAQGTDNRISTAAGGYRGQSALAVGYAHQLPGNGAVLVGGSIAGGGESSGTIGVSFGW